MTLLVLLSAVVLLLAGGTVYSRFLARSFGEDATRPAPSVRFNDGRDYVPTPTPVVFAHHFSSIAGAGPIIGPVLALAYGWLPALVWIVFGGLFIGATHDYLAALMSIRNNGQSVATIARRILGRGPFIALMLCLVLMLALVTAVFLNTSAAALVSMLEFGRMKLPDGQTLFRVIESTQTIDGVETVVRQVVIGGVASTSVIVITALAPLVGWLYLKKQVAVWKCSLLAVAICAVSIVVGLHHPVAFPPQCHLLGLTLKGSEVWKILLSVYVLVAAGLPVWLFLQSRDFINVHILYAGIALLLVTLVVAMLRAPALPVDQVALPAFDGALGAKYVGPFWPLLFITIACGAVSGFHSLCAGGTTCKQLNSESATRYIGYWGMLLESLLAVCVVCVLMTGTTKGYYLADVFPVGKDNNPVLGFAFAVGSAGNIAFGVPIAAGALAGMLLLEGFVITTLDTAVRLERYLIEELWQAFFGKYDVFADRGARAGPDAGDGEEEAGACGIPTAIELSSKEPQGTPLVTTGLFRSGLKILRHYWVNSGLAVGLMLYLSMSAGILQLWKIFATANQLLAAFVLSLGMLWLLRRGRRVRSVAVPAVFMLVTTLASLGLLLVKFHPHVVAGKRLGNTTLFVADIVILGLTLYLVAQGLRVIVAQLRQGKAAASAS